MINHKNPTVVGFVEYESTVRGRAIAPPNKYSHRPAPLSPMAACTRQCTLYPRQLRTYVRRAPRASVCRSCVHLPDRMRFVLCNDGGDGGGGSDVNGGRE